MPTQALEYKQTFCLSPGCTIVHGIIYRYDYVHTMSHFAMSGCRMILLAFSQDTACTTPGCAILSVFYDKIIVQIYSLTIVSAW